MCVPFTDMEQLGEDRFGKGRESTLPSLGWQVLYESAIGSCIPKSEV